MMVIAKKQMNELDNEIIKRFIDKIAQLLNKEFKDANKNIIESEYELKLFIKRSMDFAHNYGITEEDSIIAYVVLCFLNGENFLETEEFSAYKYYLVKRIYDPNKYIFEIPNINAT